MVERGRYPWPGRRVLRALIDGLLVLQLALGISVVWTGGIQLHLLGITLQSNSVGSAFSGVVILVLVRVLVVAGGRDFLLLCASLAFAVLAAEGMLRLWDPPLSRPNLVQVHRPSSLLGWELVPHARGVGEEGEIIRINSAGMRDEEVAPAKAPGSIRIAVVGDSFTFAMGVDVDDGYVRQMQTLLMQRGVFAEVMNFGVIGYGMWQYAALLESKVLRYRPDVVVLGLFLDDIASATNPHRDDDAWEGHNPFEHMVAARNQASRFLNLLHNANRLLESRYRHRRGYRYLQGIEERKQEIGPAHAEHDFYRAQIGALGPSDYADFARVLLAFSQRVRGTGARVVAAYIPDASQLHEPKRQHANRLVVDASRRAGIPLVDVTPLFERTADPRTLYLFPLDAHTSAEGHTLIAQAVTDLLVQHDLL